MKDSWITWSNTNQQTMHISKGGIIIAVFFGLVGANSEAAIVEVDPKKSVKTIVQGVEQAQNGDTVLVYPGYYAEGNIKVTKSISLIGLDYPVVDGGDTTEIFTIDADNIQIEGFQVQNVGTSYLVDRAGIRIMESKNFIVRNNRLINAFFGIYLQKVHHGLVEGNEIKGVAKDEASSGNAIHAWYCHHLEIKGNTLSGHRDGIYFEFVDSSSIEQNTSFENLRYGLHFMFSNYDVYRENTFERNGAGVAVMFSRHINMYGNTFYNNWGSASYGLLLKEIYDGEIKDNRFIKNTIGIFVEGSNRLNYNHNQFERNGWAIKMSGGCQENIFRKNNFMGNSFDVSTGVAFGDNVIKGNYWSDYSGYDLDRNGIGDVPYRPVKLFNYIVNQTPETIVLLRSFFIDLVNFGEKVSPLITPTDVLDEEPSMKSHPLAFTND